MVLKPKQQPPEPGPDYVWLEDVGRPTPYLKNIHLSMLKPSQFGLDKWTRNLVLPDKWMHRIYKNARKNGVEQSATGNGENLTPKQKKILYDWLTHESPFKPTTRQMPKTRGHPVSPSTDLIDVLNGARDFAEDSDSSTNCVDDGDSDDYNQSRIPILIGHKFQPEHMVFRKAIQNMSCLPPDQEERIRDFMNDPELMQELNKRVAEYLGKSIDT